MWGRDFAQDALHAGGRYQPRRPLRRTDHVDEPEPKRQLEPGRRSWLCCGFATTSRASIGAYARTPDAHAATIEQLGCGTLTGGHDAAASRRVFSSGKNTSGFLHLTTTTFTTDTQHNLGFYRILLFTLLYPLVTFFLPLQPLYVKQSFFFLMTTLSRIATVFLIAWYGRSSMRSNRPLDMAATSLRERTTTLFTPLPFSRGSGLSWIPASQRTHSTSFLQLDGFSRTRIKSIYGPSASSPPPPHTLSSIATNDNVYQPP